MDRVKKLLSIFETSEPASGADNITEAAHVPFDGDENDVIIVVMGPTGVGKSTFIKKYTGNGDIAVSGKLDSCTNAVTAYVARTPDFCKARLDGRRLILVDTPGFDDTGVPDSEILSRVATWLSSYEKGMSVGGLIYLHSILDIRMRGSLLMNFKIFTKVCGEDAFGKVVLATVHWQKCDKGEGESREKELSERYWADLLQRGATVMQIVDHESEEGDLCIINIMEATVQRFLDYDTRRQRGSTLQIQKELVDYQKSLRTTEAGKELKFTLEELIRYTKKKNPTKRERKEIAALRQSLNVLAPSFGERINKFFHW
ncbi:P-loop containing nucleoside triphosphate hydrolase protein [Coprinopsis sp. MPI-PUGE-AT-0042]|nr:P-loop containing nucleoside triphosphate hydrolase protein [Coprinopsis sp. MPI-PUGE-AT-0042]